MVGVEVEVGPIDDGIAIVNTKGNRYIRNDYVRAVITK